MSRSYRIYIVLTTILFLISTSSVAQIAIDRDYFFTQLEEGAGEEFSITITNNGNEDIDYRVRISPGDLRDDLRRDDRGGPDEMEMEWRDSNEDDGPIYDWIDITEFEDCLDLEANDDDSLYGPFDLGFVAPFYGNEYEELYIDANGFATFLPTALFPFYNNFEELPNANPGAENSTPPRTFLACNFQDLDPSLGGGHIYYWSDDYMAVVTWDNIQHYGLQGQGTWTFQLIINADGLIKYQYQNIGPYDDRPDIVIGLQNEDRDLGFTTAYNTREYIEEELAVAYGLPSAWVNWLHVDPMSGAIAPGQDAEVFVEIDMSDQDAGYYYARLLLGFSGDNPNIEIPVVVSNGVPVGSIAGVVTDASNDEIISGAVVNLNEINYTILTDENGEFGFENIPVGNWNITVTADNFNLLEEADIAVADGEVTDVLLELKHGRFELNREIIREQLAPDTDVEVSVTASNDGNAPVSFTAERRLVGDANAEPWELRREMTSGADLGDDRLQGIAFAEGNFYLAGAAGADTNQVYILNPDGELIGQFNQIGESRYGMKDLAYDGEYLWGSGDVEMFGYDLDGNLDHRFNAPFNPTNNVAWDENRGVLWTSGATTNIQAIDREGNIVGQPINRRGLRIYGLAVYPEDPDGYTLYILNNPSAELGSWLHKMNPNNGDTLRVHQITEGNAPLAESLELTNEFDIYSWVVLHTVNQAPADGGDLVKIVQLDARKDWMQVEPVEGVIQGGSAQEFTVTLDAAGLPEALFEGEVLFTHNGRGGSVVLPLELNIVLGPVQAVRQIPLSPGWNLISANLQPNDADIRTVMQDLVDAGLLFMMKDGNGHFYHPPIGFSNIPDWDVAQGYQVKVSEACNLTISGMTVMADDPIDLRAGWQMVSYYPRLPIDARVALSGIRDNLRLVKDGFGNFYLPSHNFSNMGEMREGRGYQMNLTEPAQLVYQLREQDGEIASHDGLTPTHFPVVAPTGSDMSVLIETDFTGEIGIFSGTRPVGSGVISGGLCGLAVRGDDPSTPMQDGALENDRLSVRLWDGSTELEALLTTETGEAVYSTDGLLIGKITSATTPQEFSLSGIYPNPFNSSASIGFRLAEATAVTITLYDNAGRNIATLADAEYLAGNHKLTLDGSALPSGVYFVRVATPTQSLKVKALLIR